MSAGVMRRTTGSILPDTDVIDAPSQLILAIGAGHGSRRIDLGQIVGDGSTYSFVIRGLDPAYPSSQESHRTYPSARNSRRSTLPVAVIGNVSTNCTNRGYSCAASCTF